MKLDILAWRLGKAVIILGVFSAVGYFSLVKRVEREKGSWEAWVKEAPVLDGRSSSSPVDPGTPRNIKARFWTGVPRIANENVVRIDHYGFSVGANKLMGLPIWESFYLPTTTSTSSNKKIIGLWKRDPLLPVQPDDNIPSLWEWGQLVPAGLMKNAYEWGDDAWVESNRVLMRRGFSQSVWVTLCHKLEKYAVTLGGVVVFMGPVYGYDRHLPSSFFVVVLRSTPKGPDALAMLIPADANISGEPDFNKYLVPTAEIEKATGLVFFADLPPEWRQYLLQKKPSSLWRAD